MYRSGVPYRAITPQNRPYRTLLPFTNEGVITSQAFLRKLSRYTPVSQLYRVFA